MTPALVNGRPLQRIRVGRCIFDIEERQLFDDTGMGVALTSMEFDLLYVFVTHPRRVLNRDQILELAHHREWDPYDRSVDNRIARLRKKIEPDLSHPRSRRYGARATCSFPRGSRTADWRICPDLPASS